MRTCLTGRNLLYRDPGTVNRSLLAGRGAPVAAARLLVEILLPGPIEWNQLRAPNQEPTTAPLPPPSSVQLAPAVPAARRGP